MKWEEFQEKYKDEPNYQAATEYDRICSFSDAIVELEK